MKVTEEIQRLIDTKDSLERARLMGFSGLSDEVDDGGLPMYELYHLGYGLLFHDLVDIIEEQQKLIEKMRRDHEETISDLLKDIG